MLYNIYKNNNSNIQSFTKSDLESVKKNSSSVNLDINYEDIYDMYGIYTLDKEVVGYSYKKENETYVYSSNLSHGGLLEGIIYKKLIDYRKEDNKYILDYVYIFYNGGSMTSKEDVSIYFTVSDLLNNKPFKNFNNEIDLPVYKNKTDAIEYFEIINNKIVLSNYYMK